MVLNLGETKNNEARTVYHDEELKGIFKQLWSNRRLGCAYVFHLQGKPIGDFRESLNKAKNKAGLVGMLFHDLRRTAVRNLVRAGVPEVVAMKISGHKSEALFQQHKFEILFDIGAHIITKKDVWSQSLYEINMLQVRS